MAETQRYDVSGIDRGNGRPYPAGTVLKLTEEQAKAMGNPPKSSLTTTADDVTKVDRYEQAIASQEAMREREAADVAAAEETTASSKKRSAPKE